MEYNKSNSSDKQLYLIYT